MCADLKQHAKTVIDGNLEPRLKGTGEYLDLLYFAEIIHTWLPWKM